MEYLQYAQFSLVAAFVITFVVALFAHVRRTSTNDFDKKAKATKLWYRSLFTGVAIMALLAAVTLPGQIQSMSTINKHVYAQINSVEINGEPAPDPEGLITALRAMDTSFFRHHKSHPVNRIDIRLRTDKGELEIWLGRDSQIPNQYWLHHGINDFAFVTTHLLDKY